MKDETKALETLTHEMALTRTEMAALTDSLTANRHVMESLRDATLRLVELIEERNRLPWWRR